MSASALPAAARAPVRRPPRLVFYGGKGGVGKTTCAAARALAEARAGRRVVVVSTDPAHSLADALGVPVPAGGARIAAGRGAAPLVALHLDASRAFARWLSAHRRTLGDIVERGTWLERTEADALLALPLPGFDELLAILELMRLAGRRPPPDLVVVDTAPTGHTLRLLEAPAVVTAVAGALAGLQRQHRLLRERFAGTAQPDAADRLVETLAGQARGAGERLRDPAGAAFHWVTLPEALAVAETCDALAASARARLPVAEVVVNAMIPPGARCRTCDAQRAQQRRIVAAVARSFGRRLPVRVVTAQEQEPRGLTRLAALGAQLLERPRARPHSGADRATAVSAAGPASPSTRAAPALRSRLAGRRLVMCLGKGGVGKTTTAAALALALARRNPPRPVWLISTDPAHSLSDVFDAAIRGDAIARPGVPPNLRLREIDAPALFAARRRRLESALDEIASGPTAAFATTAGGGAELLQLAPPGIDELFGLLSIADLTAGADGIVVVDTAPTGHALALLKMPAAARRWVQVLLRLLLKYRELAPPGALARELVELSAAIRRLDALLHDRERSTFVVVARASEVSCLETGRLLASLDRLRLPASIVVVNAVVAPSRRCRRCRARRTAEQRRVARLARACRRRRCAIIQAPLALPPPRGASALARWSRTWLG